MSPFFIFISLIFWLQMAGTLTLVAGFAWRTVRKTNLRGPRILFWISFVCSFFVFGTIAGLLAWAGLNGKFRDGVDVISCAAWMGISGAIGWVAMQKSRSYSPTAPS